MISFCIIVSPIIFLSLSTLIYKFITIINLKTQKKILFKNSIICGVLIFISWANLNLRRIAYNHTSLITANDNDKREEKITDSKFIKSLCTILPDKDFVIFNCKKEKNIPIMFYSSFIAYDRILNNEEYNILTTKNTKIAVIDNGSLPQFILEDKTIIKIKSPNKTW